ncbi:MAG TPA: HIG1 domain-containing protein [Thermohalobaculum sp.]|nr:HIG1 domain-containing protein [Thermohalobaculum sp.]
MSGILFFLALAAVLATFAVLALGVGGFGARWREGKEGARLSNKLMRYRIVAQLIAIVLVMLTVLAIRSGN